jgi:hypothetical protein
MLIIEIDARTIVREIVPDDEADLAGLEDDLARLAAYARGAFSYIGVRAAVEIVTPDGVTVRFTTAGVWGVESDCGASRLADLFADERATLLDSLACHGYYLTHAD